MKRLYLIALFALVCGGASAQENGNRDAQNRVVRGPYETNRLSDNIFVGIAGGINLYFGEHDSQGKFGKRLAPALDIHVGKWFPPLDRRARRVHRPAGQRLDHRRNHVCEKAGRRLV